MMGCCLACSKDEKALSVPWEKQARDKRINANRNVGFSMYYRLRISLINFLFI